MWEQVLLGTIQGIAEWLPVSSQGMLVLANQFLDNTLSINELNRHILFYHLGTCMAAIVYFQKDLRNIIDHFIRPQEDQETQQLIIFLFWSTAISGGLALLLRFLFKHFQETFYHLTMAKPVFTVAMGVLFIITGVLQLKIKNLGKRETRDLSFMDGILLGIAQGLATLPGLSRSGTTVAALLLRGFDKTSALRISFLMSLPIVLLGNIILNFTELSIWSSSLIGVIVSFIFGLLTIHLLLKAAMQLNFGLFALLLGLITIGSAFL